jgi:hypothetical protein
MELNAVTQGEKEMHISTEDHADWKENTGRNMKPSDAYGVILATAIGVVLAVALIAWWSA